MTREESWQCDGTTHAILKTISDAGYVVSVHRLPSLLLGMIPAMVEMHAFNDDAAAGLHVAKVAQNEPDAEYRSACERAKLVGIRLRGSSVYYA